MKQYLEALTKIIKDGQERTDRTGEGTKSIFGYQMRFDLSEGFPAVTTKKLAWKSVVSELLWFLEGSTDERRLAEILHGTRDISKRTIWTDNADNQGRRLGHTNTDDIKELGPVYGSQWRSFADESDQIISLINDIITNPTSRRHILSAWSVNQIDQMALPPCHVMSQFYVNNGKLSCQLYQRSADFALGVPFNIASYALLTHIIASITGLEVGEFVHTFGDAHIYLNHIEGVNEQLTRSPMALPKLIMPNFETLDDVLSSKVTDYKLENYTPMQSIRFKMAV